MPHTAPARKHGAGEQSDGNSSQKGQRAKMGRVTEEGEKKV